MGSTRMIRATRQDSEDERLPRRLGENREPMELVKYKTYREVGGRLTAMFISRALIRSNVSSGQRKFVLTSWISNWTFGKGYRV